MEWCPADRNFYPHHVYPAGNNGGQHNSELEDSAVYSKKSRQNGEYYYETEATPTFTHQSQAIEERRVDSDYANDKRKT